MTHLLFATLYDLRRLLLCSFVTHLLPKCVSLRFLPLKVAGRPKHKGKERQKIFSEKFIGPLTMTLI
jgi:hypothetical protein